MKRMAGPNMFDEVPPPTSRLEGRNIRTVVPGEVHFSREEGEFESRRYQILRMRASGESQGLLQSELKHARAALKDLKKREEAELSPAKKATLGKIIAGYEEFLGKDKA